MQRQTWLVVGLMLLICALAVGTLTVSADDVARPIVVVPEDVPGADVVIFIGETYEFDLSGSTDDVGIVQYKVEFKDAGTPVALTSTEPSINYTFTKYTETWVTVHAFDAAGNEGLGFFSIDVAEKVTTDMTIDGAANYVVDHSLYLEDADLSINNSRVSIAAGAGLGPSSGGGGGGGAPEMLGDSLTPAAGALAGHWEPYYWYSYWRTGSSTYGQPFLDTSTKMSGPASIRISSATSSIPGFEYHFNNNVDLTKFNAITFYVHSNYPSYTQYFYYMYFYGSHDYSSTYGYAYTYAGGMYTGGYASYYGWQAYTIPIDMTNVGYWYRYNMDLTSVACIRFYMASISSSYSRWIDNVGLYTANWGDAMTESATPSGDYGGRWSSAGGVGASTSVKYVGKSSVYATLPSSGTYNDIYYYFNKPTNLAAFNAIRFFCTMQDQKGTQVSYSYYWPSSQYYNLYVYDSSGRYCSYYEYSSHYTYYGNGWVWFAHSLPFGTAQAYTNTGVDMTKVSYIRLANIYTSYVYPGGYPYNFFIDGFEFYSQTSWMGGGAEEQKPDYVPLGIYMKGGDLSITGNSRIVGTGATGARLMVDGGSATVRNATFDNMWYTEGSIVPNVLHSLGGLEVYGDADIAGASFVNCNGPGLALFDGTYSLDRATIDLSGTTMKVKGSPKLIMGLTERTTRASTIDLSGWVLEDSAAGTGALVMVADCPARTTVKVHGNGFDNNAYAGVAISCVRCSIDPDVQVYEQTVQGGGTGLIVSVTGPATSATRKATVRIWDCVIDSMKAQGATVTVSGIDMAASITIDNCTFTKSGDVGLLMSLKSVKGDMDIALNKLQVNENVKEGAIVKFEGAIGGIDVDITDSAFKRNQAAGLSVLCAAVTSMPGSTTGVRVSRVVLDSNAGAGLAIGMDDAVIEATAALTDVESMGNTGPGLLLSAAKVNGNVTFLLTGVESHDNTGHGMHLKTSQELARQLTTYCTVTVEYDACAFEYNKGSGVLEEHSAVAGALDDLRSGMMLKVTGTGLTASQNQGDGYNIGPSGSPQYGLRDASYTFTDSDFSTNKRTGFYVKELYNNDGQHGYAREHIKLHNCTLSGNSNGFEQYWERNSYGTETTVLLDHCSIKENEVMSVYAHGYESATSGESMLQSASFTIADSYMDDQATLDISGAYDLNGLVIPTLNVTVVNNTYRADMPVGISLSGYYNCLRNAVVTNVVYRSNTHLMTSAADGLLIEVLGGTKLQANVVVEDAEFINPGGHGVKVVFGTTHNTVAQRKLAIILISMSDVTVRNALYNGVDIDEKHANTVAAYSIGRYSITRLDVRDAVIGVRSESVNGEIRDSQFSRIIENTIYVNSGIIDVYDSVIGEITKENLVVDERSAIRLWYSMLLKVVWSTTGAPVNGASLEVRDNTWSIIGIDIIDGSEGVLFGNLNSVIVDYIGIVTRNPYIASIEYRGLQREVTVNVTKRIELTIYLVDDIAPRLTIESPRDGIMQREHAITVMGGAYDMHSGIDHVVASFDGETWHNATGSGVYECTLTDVPDGMNVIMVRAYDSAGNYAEASVAVLIDSIPPPLNVITPSQGQRTRSSTIEVVGITDVGAFAYIDGVQVSVAYTLISHVVSLREGMNAIKVTVTDQLGNAREVIVDVFLDTQAPYLALLSPENGATVNTDDVRLLGLTETEDVAVHVGTTAIPTDANGRFSMDAVLVPGVNHIELVAVDGVGNERHLPVVLTYDDIPPWLKIVEPLAQSIHNVNEVAVAGYVKDGTRVFVNGREVDVVLGQFRTNIYVPEGGADVVVVAVDEAGNELSTTVPILVDTTPPGIELTSPVDGMTTNVRTLAIAGLITTEDNPKELELTINGVEFPVGLDRGIHQTYELLDGVNTITVGVIDLAGNSVSLVRTVVFDASAPYLTFGFENTRVDPFWSDPVSLSTFVFVTGFTEVGATLTVNGAFVEVDPFTGRFNCTVELPLPPVGYKVSRTQVRVVATDAAGNVAVQEGWVNRLEGEIQEPVEVAEDNGSMLLVFAMIILLLAVLMAVAYRYYDQRVERAERLEAEGEGGETVVALEPEGGKQPPRGKAGGQNGPKGEVR